MGGATPRVLKAGPDGRSISFLWVKPSLEGTSKFKRGEGMASGQRPRRKEEWIWVGNLCHRMTFTEQTTTSGDVREQ